MWRRRGRYVVTVVHVVLFICEKKKNTGQVDSLVIFVAMQLLSYEIQNMGSQVFARRHIGPPRNLCKIDLRNEFRQHYS